MPTRTSVHKDPFADISRSLNQLRCEIVSHGQNTARIDRIIDELDFSLNPIVWIPVTTFDGTWSSVGTPSYDVAYSKDDLGIVRLRGRVTGGTNATSAFTLPAAYSPTNTMIMPIIANAAAASLTIGSDGTVVPSAGGTTYASLDGIAFGTP